MVLNVKAFLEKNGDIKGEIRRFQVPSASGAEMYILLTTKVADLFALPENGFCMFWQDSDGDFVTFSSTAELMEAIKGSLDGVLRLYIKPTQDQGNASSGQTAGEGEPSGEKTQEEKVHHPGVICDGCESSIYGPRYKCVICPDYDLCSVCEQKGLHPEHDKFKITHPQTAGGPMGFMPPHFRRWMHRFMKRCQAGQGCPAGATATGQAAGGESSTGAQQGEGATPGSAEDEYLNNIGEDIRAFLDPFGVDVSYEVRHGDQSARGGFNTNDRGRCGGRGRTCGGRGGAWNWNWGACGGNQGGCFRMPQAPKPSTSQEAEKPTEKPAEKPTEKPAEKPTEEPASEQIRPEVDVEEGMTQPKTPDAPRSKETSPTRSHDDDWTMLNEGEVTTDGESSAAGTATREGLYPNLKVTQAVEMMKAMGFSDDGGWLTRLLETTDGDIAGALDTLRLGAQQASKLA